MSRAEFIVTVAGDRFLGWSGALVSEYPDARLFYTRTEAAGAIAAAGLVGQSRVVSATDYAGGAA